jgi:hypothetical protein
MSLSPGDWQCPCSTFCPRIAVPVAIVPSAAAEADAAAVVVVDAKHDGFLLCWTNDDPRWWWGGGGAHAKVVDVVVDSAAHAASIKTLEGDFRMVMLGFRGVYLLVADSGSGIAIATTLPRPIPS